MRVSKHRRLDKLCHNVDLTAMATMNVSLPDPMKTWAESRTKDGRYSNVSDYVRDLIRRDQARESAIAEVQQMIDAGLESGPSRPFNRFCRKDGPIPIKRD